MYFFVKILLLHMDIEISYFSHTLIILFIYFLPDKSFYSELNNGHYYYSNFREIFSGGGEVKSS